MGGGGGRPMPDPAELGEGATGGSISGDFGGHITGGSVTVDGVGPFRYPAEQPPGHPQQAAPQTTPHQDEELRHNIDLLLQAIQHIEAQQDADGIAHAMMTVLTIANSTIHGTEWVESEGLADETRHWAGITGADGAIETFQTARDQVVAAANHLLQVLEHLLTVHDLVNRSIERGARGGESLQHLAQVAAHVRGQLSHTTPQSLHLLDEAITLLQQAANGEQIVRDVLGVLSMANNAMLGDNWEQSLANEYTNWAGMSEQSGQPAQFTQAQHDILAAAHTVRQSLDQWQYHRMDASHAAQLAHPLVQATEQARQQLHP